MKPRQSASENEAPRQGGSLYGLRRLPGYAALSWLRQVIVSRNFRETARLRALPPPGLFQPTGHTKFDRHPDLFSFVRERVGDGPDRQLLSFGCSTGEEVFSLRRYFAESRITGIDISPRRIRECQRRARRQGADPALRFVAASSAEQFAPQSIDAIFANSVLRHGDLALAPPRCDHRISFADFERIVSGLARCIKPGGLLVLRYANFRFADTEAASDFAPILRMTRDRTTPIYDTVNRLAPQEPQETVVFQRRE